MRRAQLLVILTFIALFSAGAVSALVATRLASDKPEPRHRNPDGPGGPGGPRSGGGGGGGGGGPSWLAAELDLAPDQQHKMREIWGTAREQMQTLGRDRRRELARQRDEEVRNLLTPDQRAAYDQILANHERKLDDLRESGEAVTRQAEQKTREILTPPQRLKYEELLKQRKPNDEPRPPKPNPAP